MSIVIAIVGKDSIVIEADTICMKGDNSAHYADKHSKLYKTSNPQFVIGLAGSRGAERFLNQRQEFSGMNFDDSVDAYKALTFRDYEKGNRSYDFYYLFCGYSADGKARLERARFQRDSYNGGNPISDLEAVGPKHAIGISRHGAWYILQNYFQNDMSTDQTMLLTYLSLREVIRHDERTKHPIEMMIVRPGVAAQEVSLSDLQQMKKETDQRLSAVTQIIQAPFALGAL